MGARAIVSLSILVSIAAIAADQPPAPSKTSTVGQAVTNPVTGTTVSALVLDPAGTLTAGASAWVQTADGCSVPMKVVGETQRRRQS